MRANRPVAFPQILHLHAVCHRFPAGADTRALNRTLPSCEWWRTRIMRSGSESAIGRRTASSVSSGEQANGSKHPVLWSLEAFQAQVLEAYSTKQYS
jgi:hypothetical protein